MFETRIAIPRPFRCLGIDFVQIADHFLDRGVEAVEIESVEADLLIVTADAIVVLAQPADETEHVGVAPHPGRKALEVAESVDRFGVVADSANKSIDAVGVRPIRLHCDGVEPLLGDEPPRDLRARRVELVRSVRSFADQDEMSVADEVQQRIEIAASACELAECSANFFH